MSNDGRADIPVANAVRARRKRPRIWALLGAGLITGASDDDPSGIGTYAQAGAAFGFQLGWTLLFSYPLMVVIQEISARIGRTTVHGIAGNLRKHYPNWLLQSIVALLFVANTLNIGADLGAMSESTRLLWPHAPGTLVILFFGLLCTLLQMFVSHKRYVRVLKGLTLVLLAYFAVLLVVRISWSEALRGVIWPSWSLRGSFWLMVLAIFGTTISPYLFFWQAAQEVEDTRLDPRRVPLRANPAQAPAALTRIRVDTVVGMGLSNLVGLAILITAGATIHEAGIHNIATAADAALMLREMAGFDPRDSTSVDTPVPDYVAALEEPITGLRIGVLAEFFDKAIELLFVFKRPLEMIVDLLMSSHFLAVELAWRQACSVTPPGHCT